MTKKITNANIGKMASTIKSFVEKNYKLPKKMTYDGVTFNQCEIAYIMAHAVLYPKKDVKISIAMENASNPKGDKIVEQIKPDDYKDQAKRLIDYITKNKQAPNFVRTKKSNKRVRIRVEIYSLAKIVVWYNKKGKLPTECLYQYTVFYKEKPVTKVETPEEVLAYFEKVFGVTIKYMDDALEIMNNRGYAYYYDDAYSNKESIDRIKDKKGINCTDALHVFINIVKALIQKYNRYKSVDCLHVLCSGGDGHVRGRVKLSDGSYAYRDPACTLSENDSGAYCNWCTSNYALLDINPSWFTKDLNR